MQVAHGSVEWLTSTAATGTYSQGDVGFTIKAMVFWWTGIASGGSDANTEAVDMRRGIGFATGTSARRCVASYDDDAALTSDASTAVYDDCIAATHSNAAARDGALDITAMGTGFTLTVDDQLPTGNLTLHWLAFGGDDISVAVVGNFTEPASATTVDVTATGLTSDGVDQVIFFAGAQATAAINSVSAENGGISFGVATSTDSADQWCVAGSTDHASGTTDTDGIGGTGKVVAQAPLASGTAFVTAALTAWGTDQFTVTYAGTVVSGRKNAFLAIKGGKWKAGSYTIEGDTGSATAAVSSLPLVPKGIVIAGRMNAAQNASTGNANDQIGIGWGTSTSSRRTQGVLNENGTASSAVEVNQTAQFDAVLAFPSTGGALQAAYDINAMSSDGFEIIVDTAGGVASEWQGYVAFGDPAQVPLTGVAGTGSVGSLGIPPMRVSFAELEIPDAGGAGEEALTGVSGTGAVAAFGVAVVIALSGVGGTGSVGSLSASASAPLSGISATAAVGSVSPDVFVALSGVGGTGSAGSLAASANASLSGVEATGAVGTLSPSSEAGVALSGVSGTGAAGSVAASVTTDLTGEAATGAVGNLSPATAVMSVSFAELEIPSLGVSLTGVEGTGAAGSLGVDVEVALSGVSGTGSPGSLSAGGDVPLQGVEGAGAVDSLGVVVEADLSGVSASGAPGSLAAAVSKALSGVSGTGSVGSLVPGTPIMSVSFAELEIPGSGASLTGVEGVGAVGNLTAGVSSLALTGVSATGAVGSLGLVSPAVSRLGLFGVSAAAYAEFEDAAPAAELTGVEGTGAVGSFEASVSIALSGVQGAGAVGSPDVAVTAALAGVAGAGAAGSLETSVSVALSGIQGTGAVGSLVFGSAAALTGVQGAGAVGTFEAAVALQLSGVSASGEVGFLGVPGAQTLTGAEATGEVGTLEVSVSTSLAGVDGSGAAGSLAAAVALELSGVSATGAVDYFSIPGSGRLVGVEGTGEVGTLTPVIADYDWPPRGRIGGRRGQDRWQRIGSEEAKDVSTKIGTSKAKGRGGPIGGESA